MSIFQSVSLIEIAEESPLSEYELERNHTETFHENDLPTPPSELDQEKRRKVIYPDILQANS